jgi:hypothetical protein
LRRSLNRAFSAPLFLLVGVCLSAEAQERATLTLQAQPGVDILWQGVRLGTTEADGRLVIRNVPPGEFEIRLSKPGYQYRTEWILIEGSQPVTHAFPLEAPQLMPSPTPEKQLDAARPNPVRPTDVALPNPEGQPDVTPPVPGGRRQTPTIVSTETPQELPNLPTLMRDQDPVTPSKSRGTTLILLLLAALGALLWFKRKKLPFLRPASDPAPAGQPPRPTWDPPAEEPADSSESQDLLTEIRRRERDLDDESQGRPRVIEAEFVELPNPEERAT